MSWDLFVQDIPANVRSVEEILDDFAPQPIGKRSEVIQKIKALIPTANFDDPAWGLVDGPDYSIEANMGNEEELEGFTFHVRGGDQAACVVASILEHLGLRAFDPQSDSGIFTPPGVESLRRWRAYRDQVVNGPSADPQP